MPALSLRLRLTLLWSVVSLAVLLGLELLTLAVLSAQLSRTIDRDLAQQATQYRQWLAGGTGIEDIQRRALSLPSPDTTGSGLAPVYVVLLQGRSIVTNTADRGLQDTIIGVQAQPGEPTTVHDRVHGDLRVAVIPIEQGGFPIGDLRVALPLVGVESTVGDLLTPLLAGNSALIVLGGLAAYGLIGGGLAPIRQITAAAAGISEGDLSRRIGHQGPGDEVGRLAATFDGMLSRLESGFEQRRAFYALASHELRTPLTIARGHLEVLRRVGRPTPTEVHEAVDVALEELDRITEEVDDMLLLGRMLLGRPGRMEEIDARSVVRAVHTRARGLAPRDWRLEVGGHMRVRADEEQLGRALLNLVINAVRHTEDGDQIGLACRVSASWARLEVADTGAGIPAADLPHLFAPWYRVGGPGGSVGGLGLVIVREVARAHGGEVDVESREGAGTTFTIRVPLLAAETGAGLRDVG